jgi:uncharacterized membrane protein
MLSYETYKILHVLGVFVLFTAFGGSAMLASREGDAEETRSHRKLLSIIHGVAMLVVFVAGFGLMARLGMMKSWPLWIWVKLGVWAVLGGALALVRRKPGLVRVWYVVLPLVGGIAATMAITKPT